MKLYFITSIGGAVKAKDINSDKKFFGMKINQWYLLLLSA